MASNINSVGVCARKGDIPIGTGLRSSADFCLSNQLPLDSSGNALPGYSLQSSSTSANGTNWGFQGANGRTIRTYSYPSQCPVPFPGPDDVNSDLVQITREDRVVAANGLVDIAMPVLGIQGRVPTHSLPSLCDVSNQVIFFFDDANASINVYQPLLKTWRMGWMRAILTNTVRWRAADLLTEDKIRSTNQYTAPYNAKGLFVSIVSSSFVNQNQQTKPFDEQNSGLFFVNYTVTNGEIQSWGTANLIQPVPLDEDVAVSAIATVNQNVNIFRTASNEAIEVVAAVAVANNSSLCDNLYGWWGFLARQDADPFTPNFFNPDLSTITTTTPLNFCFKNGDTPTGFVETISYDNNVLFFLGGNFDYVLFDNAVVTRPVGAGTQRAAVAMQYKYTAPDPAMTVENYQFVGLNQDPPTNWSGRVAQSNYANGYFAYGGNFTTAPSAVSVEKTSSRNVKTFDAGAESISAVTNSVVYTANVPSDIRGGVIVQTQFLFDISSSILPNTGSVNDLGVCLNLVPDNGDVKEGSFPPRFIGGNFLNPARYVDSTLHIFQTQQPIKPIDWWLSYVTVWVEEAVVVPVMTLALYPIDRQFQSLAQLPYYWSLLEYPLVAGRNRIPVLGGTTVVDKVYNSHIIQATSSVDISESKTYVLQLEARTELLDPFNIKLGYNDGNGNAFAGCWTLEGYPATNVANALGGEGRFSSYALNGGTPSATYTQNALSGENNDYTLTYTTSIPVPLNTQTYTAYLIPINAKPTGLGFTELLAGVVNETQDGIATFSYREDTQGNFKYSCLHNATVPSVVYEIPTMNTTTGVQPSFSLFMNSKYEVYKTAFANGDTVGFGLYTNFQEITEVPYNVSVATPPGANQCKITVAGLVTTLVLNIGNIAEVPQSWPDAIKTNDIVRIQKTSTLEFNQYRITNIVNTSLLIRTYTLETLTGTATFSSADTVLITFVLSRNPLQTPFVLKDDFGQFVLGNGSDPTTLRDVYLSPFQSTGKAYRYIPNYENNFLSFSNGLYLGAPTTDDVSEVNTALFNSNESSILLTRARNPVSNKWAVSRVTGNVGFNTQLA
jgi:hypothetical protein